MNKYTLIIIGFIVTTTNYAADSPVYFGVSAGQTRILQDVNGNYALATTATLSAGYLFTDSSYFQGIVEGSYTQSIKKENATINGSADEYKEDTIGIFLAARSKADIYAKTKLGLVNHRITANTAVTYNKTKLSTGVGFGIKHESGGITEVEYVIYDDDISLVNIGYLF